MKLGLMLIGAGVVLGNLDRMPTHSPYDALRAYLLGSILLTWAMLWMAVFEALGVQGIWR